MIREVLIKRLQERSQDNVYIARKTESSLFLYDITDVIEVDGILCLKESPGKKSFSSARC